MSGPNIAPGACWSAVKGGLSVRVRLTPRSDRDAVEGVVATSQGAALKVSVRAVPDKGEANRALIRTLAQWLEVPRSSIAVIRGPLSRNKTLAVAGEEGRLCALLAARLAAINVKSAPLRGVRS